jgi:hypothetical protein
MPSTRHGAKLVKIKIVSVSDAEGN